MKLHSFPARSPIQFLIKPQTSAAEVLQQSRDEALESRAQYRQELTREVLWKGAVGAGVGAALLGGAYQMPHGLWVGVAFGASVGIYTAWEALHRQKTGQVQVQLDGKNYTKPFAGNLQKYELNPEEAELVVKSQSPDAGRITAFQGKLASLNQPLGAWKDSAPILRELASQRRLVAQLDQPTPNGQSVVHLVDAVGAARLAEEGKSVYLVQAQEPKDVQRSLTLYSLNRASSKSHLEEYKVLERQVEYQLHPLRQPSDLQSIPDGLGVPEGMLGLLEKSQSYSEVLNRGQQEASQAIHSPEFGNGPIQYSENQYYTSSQRLQNNSLQFTPKPGNTTHVNLPGLLGLIGTTAGLATALALTGPGVPGPALIAGTVGFLGGRALGRALI